MKKTFLILIAFFIAHSSYSQRKDTVKYSYGISFNIESMVVRDLKLNFTQKISARKYIDACISFSIPNFDSNMWDNYFWGLYDPFFYYGRIQLRAGIKFYLHHYRRYYLCPMLLYSYGKFKDGDASYTDQGFHKCINRTKIDLEIMFKTGWTYPSKHRILQDIYLGIGLRYKFMSDEVLDDLYEDTSSYLPHPPYPYHEINTMLTPVIHFGYQFGWWHTKKNKD